MKITTDSHTDHGLTPAHLQYLAEVFAERTAFFIETIQLPEELAPVPCGLHGPLMGDAPIEEGETYTAVRGGRAGPSRMCHRPVRLTRTVTVIAGPHAGLPCVLYTAYGGASAPREAWERGLSGETVRVSEAFWAVHALSET